jgi:hypothetical protein
MDCFACARNDAVVENHQLHCILQKLQNPKFRHCERKRSNPSSAFAHNVHLSFAHSPILAKIRISRTLTPNKNIQDRRLLKLSRFFANTPLSKNTTRKPAHLDQILCGLLLEELPQYLLPKFSPTQPKKAFRQCCEPCDVKKI